MRRGAAKGVYKGFRATGAIMVRLGKLEPEFSGAVRVDDDGFLA